MTGLALLAQGGGDPTFGDIDPSTRRGLVYGLLLVVGALVAVIQFQRLLGLLFKLVGKLVGLVVKAVLGFIRWNYKVLLEMAAYLGYQGKRLLIFLGCVAITVGLWWMFGWWVAAKFAAVWIFFALTSRKRRALRQIRRLEGLMGRFDQLERKFDAGMNALGGRLRRLAGFERQPTAAEQAAERARREHERLLNEDLPFPEPRRVEAAAAGRGPRSVARDREDYEAGYL